MGTLVLQNSYSIRRWFGVPFDNILTIIRESDIHSLDGSYAEWIPSENEIEKGTVIGDKPEVLKAYNDLVVALAYVYPERYCKGEKYTLEVVNNEVRVS